MTRALLPIALAIFTARLLLGQGTAPVASQPSAATKAGRTALAFRKALVESIGHQWYARVEAHRRELKLRTTHITLVISGEGAIRNLQIVSNTSNGRAASLVIDAIKHADIPPPPPEVLKDNVFEQDLKFTIYPK